MLWVADRAPLIESLSILPPYLRNAASESGEVIDYRDWHVPLGRRFRALKLWWVLRSYGAAGLRHHLREHIALAGELGRRVDEHPRLERVAPVSFALVCFRHVDGNDADRRPRRGDQRAPGPLRDAVGDRRHALRPGLRRPDAHDGGRRRAPVEGDQGGGDVVRRLLAAELGDRQHTPADGRWRGVGFPGIPDASSSRRRTSSPTSSPKGSPPLSTVWRCARSTTSPSTATCSASIPTVSSRSPLGCCARSADRCCALGCKASTARESRTPRHEEQRPTLRACRPGSNGSLSQLRSAGLQPAETMTSSLPMSRSTSGRSSWSLPEMPIRRMEHVPTAAGSGWPAGSFHTWSRRMACTDGSLRRTQGARSRRNPNTGCSPTPDGNVVTSTRREGNGACHRVRRRQEAHATRTSRRLAPFLRRSADVRTNLVPGNRRA